MIDPAEQPLHILVVDDDLRIRQMLTRYFEQEGYRVSAAADGAAMRAEEKARPVDVILLDVVMPGQDGLTIAREIRAKSEVGNIMLTGRDEVLDRVVDLEVGADDYVAKPSHLPCCTDNTRRSGMQARHSVISLAALARCVRQSNPENNSMFCWSGRRSGIVAAIASKLALSIVEPGNHV
jgi:CheY-like chemotaxis protein